MEVDFPRQMSDLTPALVNRTGHSQAGMSELWLSFLKKVFQQVHQIGIISADVTALHRQTGDFIFDIEQGQVDFGPSDIACEDHTYLRKDSILASNAFWSLVKDCRAE